MLTQDVANNEPAFGRKQGSLHWVHYIWQRLKLLNKFVIFVLFLRTKAILVTSTLRLNHCSHVDNFNHVFNYLSGRQKVQCRCCLCVDQIPSDFIKNILICVLKMNEGLMGVERHGVINERIFIFVWTNPLTTLATQIIDHIRTGVRFYRHIANSLHLVLWNVTTLQNV